MEQLAMSLVLELVIELVHQHYGVVKRIVQIHPWKESLVFCHAAKVSYVDISITNCHIYYLLTWDKHVVYFIQI